jgi:small subunit ribosomal protein S20
LDFVGRDFISIFLEEAKLANHASALKRAKQTEIRRVRNKAYRTKVRNMVKLVRQAVDAKDVEQAQTALNEAVPMIDKAASKGVYHKNNAARKVARLSKQVHALSAAE